MRNLRQAVGARAWGQVQDRMADVQQDPHEEVAFHQPPELIGEVVETLTGIQQFVDSWVLPAVRGLL